MKTWVLSEIRDQVRRITGKLSVNQMSDADVNDWINYFYTQMWPKKLFSPLFEGWWEYTTAIAEDAITVDNQYLELRPPFTINGHSHIFKQDPVSFYHRWPESQTFDGAEPHDALLYGKTLILRPPPDGAYDLKAAALIAPDPLASDSAAPLDVAWGLPIAYGAAIIILLRGGDYDGAKVASEVYQSLEESESYPGILQLSTQRAMSRY